MSERTVLDLRRVGIPEVPVLGRYDYREAHRGIALHAHRGALEICYLAKGRQLYRVGNSDYVLAGGDVFVTFPDETHSTGEAPQEKGRLYWVEIMLPRRPRAFLNSDRACAAALVARLRGLPHRHFRGASILGSLLDQIIAAASGPIDPLQRLAIQNRLVDFLLRVLDLADRQPGTRVSSQISDLLRYIDSNLHRKLPLRELAARARLSIPRLKARFKLEVGMPPAEYVMRCKIAVARRRLADPSVTITRVAMDLSFASSQYFATVFRRFTGQRPSMLRRSVPAAAARRQRAARIPS